MREGDILIWKTVNGTCTGKVIKSEHGEPMLMVDGRTAFRLKDVSESLSLKTVSAQSL